MIQAVFSRDGMPVVLVGFLRDVFTVRSSSSVLDFVGVLSLSPSPGIPEAPGVLVDSGESVDFQVLPQAGHSFPHTLSTSSAGHGSFQRPCMASSLLPPAADHRLGGGRLKTHRLSRLDRFASDRTD